MKKFTRILICLISLVFVAGTTGCISLGPEQSKKPIADLNAQIKAGMTQDQVKAVAGEAQSVRQSSNGSEIWEYFQNAAEENGMSTLVKINSMGMFKNVPSQYQDILDVTFTNGVVATTSYLKNYNLASGMQK
jgi:SmpA / OmlA family